MNIKKLNEELDKIINEGEVLSFADYKDRKEDIANKYVDDEISSYINENTLHVKIGTIIVNDCEKVDGVAFFREGESIYYEGFQDRVYSLDYAMRKLDKTATMNITVNLFIDELSENKQISMKEVLGYGRYNVEITEYIQDKLEEETDKKIEIKNRIVRYDENRYEKEFKIFNQRIENSKKKLNKENSQQNNNQNSNQDFVRDYRKDPMDVQVGDILVCRWGYSMVLVDYYRVTERKAKSIRLEKLKDKILTGNGMQGTCMPSNEVDSDRQQEDVKGKLFRIGASWSKDLVCQVKGQHCYFWDGTPDSYDHMD